MIFDELSARYNSPIPRDEKAIILLGSREAYHLYFLQRAERQFAKRCLHIVQSLAAWRVIDRYAADIREMMLKRLQKILFQTRGSAVQAFDLSKVAVTAAPTSTA